MGEKIVLITGGMGYIGSRVAAKLPGSFIIDRKAGTEIEPDVLGRYLPKVSAVIHLAGTHYAFSARDCYHDLASFITLLDGMRGYGVRKLILASSAAVYGDNVESPVSEDHPTNPTTPYGRYKLMCEEIAVDYGFDLVAIRPFNASGGLAKFIPNVKSGKVAVCGDGNAVRDFVHVDDLADAFVKALYAPPGVYNIGSGVGHTLNEVIALQGNVEVQYREPRPNDPQVLVADITKARTVLNWEPKHTIKDVLC